MNNSSYLVQQHLITPSNIPNTRSFVFSITKSKQLEMFNESKLAAAQTSTTESSDTASTLGVKSLRNTAASIPNSNLETQPGTPNKDEPEVDSYKLKENKASKQKEVIRTFKPCIFYGGEATAKGTSYFKNAMGNFLLHAFQSISIIQKLKPIPQQLIDAHKIMLPLTSSTALL